MHFLSMDCFIFFLVHAHMHTAQVCYDGTGVVSCTFGRLVRAVGVQVEGAVTDWTMTSLTLYGCPAEGE